MSDQIELAHGSLPWRPTADSTLIRVFDEYDIPTEGVIAQDGCFYLFECLAGRVVRPGLWMYTHIQSDELAELDKAEGGEFAELVLRIQATHPAKFAVSVQGEGVVAESVALEMPSGMADALQDVVEAFQRYVDHLVRSRAEMEVVRPDPWERLVPA